MIKYEELIPYVTELLDYIQIQRNPYVGQDQIGLTNLSSIK
jgi:hypothetical protein